MRYSHVPPLLLCLLCIGLTGKFWPVFFLCVKKSICCKTKWFSLGCPVCPNADLISSLTKSYTLQKSLVLLETSSWRFFFCEAPVFCLRTHRALYRRPGPFWCVWLNKSLLFALGPFSHTPVCARACVCVFRLYKFLKMPARTSLGSELAFPPCQAGTSMGLETQGALSPRLWYEYEGGRTNTFFYFCHAAQHRLLY